MADNEFYMERALELALKGRGFVSPNPMVGAVIVKDGKILAEGWHHRYGDLHAERDAFSKLKEDCTGADMYVTLEPCCHYGKQPPCTETIIEHKIKRVFIGSDDPNPLVNGKGCEILESHGIQVFRGILKEECDSINKIFFHYIKNKMPYCICKYAMTADGKISSYSGDSKWISCDKSRELVHKMRGVYRGILVGINTVLADNPMLNCRLEGRPSPVRIICDSSLKIPFESKIVKTAGEYETIIATISKDKEKISALREKGINVIAAKEKDGHIDLKDLFLKLGELKIDSILIEGGGDINFSVLNEGLCSRLYVFVAPKILGGKTAKTPVGGRGIEKVGECISLGEPVIRRIGDDILLEYEVV
ncbi:MAG: bifunctional diaminohydroxyphosphoribosylaminopyrimidine deaminase/5-amino-6-(5-phosphoribosylamino)uracil reductase RibD [Clostridiales bacterium]|nr:bifunctional diaminohydroxyphosphoribosylaminopyrimidine deaminase/5-amino-6-(5-phosphoribosylamino)uracil reductase RibD [Clostridiales bacterium]